MANRMETKSKVRTSNSYESSSHARWSTQSNCSGRSQIEKDKSEDHKKMRMRLEKSLWSLLDDFNPKASINKTHDTAQEVMKLVEKFCRFRSQPKSSHATKAKPTTLKQASASKSSAASKSSNATKSSSTAKSSIATKLFENASKRMNAPKSFASSKLPGAAKSFSTVKSCGAEKSSNAAESSITANSFTVAKSKPSSIAAREVVEVKNELKRLSDSDGFVTLFPSQYKRVPKPVQRFAVNLYDEKRARRSNHPYQSNETDLAVADTPKKKANVDENKTVFEVQQHQTISQTTSTIGSYHYNK